MKLLFHENTLGLRGTTQAVYDYAYFAKTLLRYDSVVAYDANHAENDPGVIAKFAGCFDLVPYNALAELQDVNVDLGYVIKVDRQKKTLPGVPTVVHEVFQRFEPHGEVYAYVSEWLSDYRTGGRFPFVPHMVSLPPGQSQRAQLGIPDDAFVFGRYGGFETFDLEFVQETVAELLKDPKIWCVFVNTAKFIDHPRALFLPSVVRPEEKSNFIVTCDAMLHGRKRGESFGLAIAEFLFHNRPVLAWAGGKDRNHVQMLGAAPCALYNDRDDLLKKAKMLRERPDFKWKSLVEQYEPAPVMQRFKDVFVDQNHGAATGNTHWINLGYRFRRVFGGR